MSSRAFDLYLFMFTLLIKPDVLNLLTVRGEQWKMSYTPNTPTEWKREAVDWHASLLVVAYPLAFRPSP